MNTTSKEGSLFELDGVPKLSQAFPLALQHVVAMIVGCVTPAIIISGAAGLETADRVLLIQASLVVSALATLLQLFPIGKRTGFHLGAGLPVIIGVSFAYVPSMQAIADGYGIDTIMGAQIVGGIVAVIMGILVKKIRVFFPPLITGTVVFTIGLSLYPTAINYMAGGTSNPDYLAELAGCILHPGCCNCAESFWKRNLEAFLHSDRYAGRISGIHSLWHGESVQCWKCKRVPAAPADALWSAF